MRYETTKPFEIPRQPNGLVDRDALDAFWDDATLADGRGLSCGIGCYVFAIESGRGVLPWYVGRASGREFEEECFEHHKLTHYNDVLASRARGRPLLTLFAKLTPTGRFSKASESKTAHRDIGFLETHLIGLCIRRNPDLRNIKETAFLRRMEVPGVINSPQGGRGGRSSGVQQLKRLLGTI